MRVQFAIGNDNLNPHDISFWCDLEIIPTIGYQVRVIDFLHEKDHEKLLQTSACWDGDDAEVYFITLKKDAEGWYYWIWLRCEESD